jgi:hypothetical protein
MHPPLFYNVDSIILVMKLTICAQISHKTMPHLFSFSLIEITLLFAHDSCQVLG